MLKSIQILLNAFEENNIKYCHWKSNEHLKPALNGDTDLDILFSPEQRSKLEGVLSKCKLKRFRSTPLSQYNAIEDYIGFDKDEAKIWHLHLHYRLTIGEKNLKGYTLIPWTDKVLKGRIKSPLGCYMSSHEMELILIFVRMSLKLRIVDFTGKLSSDDILEIDWLRKRIDRKHVEQLLNDLFIEETRECFLDVIYKEKIRKKNLYILQRKLHKELNLYTYHTVFGASLISYLRSIYSIFGGINRKLNLNLAKPSRRVSPSGGCVIAFLGSDGAGKTTTIQYVKSELSKKLDIKTIYLGSGDGECSLIRRPMRFVARRVGGKGVGASVEKEYEINSKSNNKITLKARCYSIAKVIWAVTLAYEKRKKIKEITKARNRGMIVLIDRYPQVEFPGFSDGPLLTNYITYKRGFLYRMALREQRIYLSALKNPPDLFVKLIVPANIAIERKPEMTEDEIIKKINIVKSIFNDQNNVIIDSSVEKKQSFANVMDAIWGYI